MVVVVVTNIFAFLGSNLYLWVFFGKGVKSR